MKSESLGNLFKALALAQGEMEAATTDASNPFFKSKYAKLEHVVKASRPFLTKHGLCVMQMPVVSESGQLMLVTKLAHESGEWVEACMPINPPKTDIQSMGSYITYLRRYNYSCITGTVTEDEADDDGNKAKEDKKREEEMEALKKKVHELEESKIEEIANALNEKLGIQDYDGLLTYISTPQMRKSSIFSKDGIESMTEAQCTKFISWYQKWLEANKPVV